MNLKFRIIFLKEGESDISHRIYPKEELIRMVDKFNVCFGELRSLPDKDDIGNELSTDILKASHIIENIGYKDGALYADIKTLDTPAGKLIRECELSKIFPHPIMTGMVNDNKICTDLKLHSLHLSFDDPKKVTYDIPRKE